MCFVLLTLLYGQGCNGHGDNLAGDEMVGYEMAGDEIVLGDELDGIFCLGMSRPGMIWQGLFGCG